MGPEGVALLDREVGHHDGDDVLPLPGVEAEDGAEQRAEGGEDHLVTGNTAIATPQPDVTLGLLSEVGTQHS